MPESNVGERSSYPEVAALIRDLSLKVRNALRPTFEGRGRELIPPQAKVAATALQRINPCKASVVVNAAGLRTCSNLDRPTPLTHADGELWDAIHAAFMVCVRLASGERPTTADADALEACADALHVVPGPRQALEPLLGALVATVAASGAILTFYPLLLERKESHGLPKAEDWPGSFALEHQRAQHDGLVEAARQEYAEAGESVVVGAPLEPTWTALMREWSGYYRGWRDAIGRAKDLAESPGVAAIMDAGEARPAHRWTTQTIIDLNNLAGTLHPIGTGGVDGLGFIRRGLPPLPQDFRTHAEAVGKRICELRSIPVSAVPPTPTVSVSPDLLDRLQRAAAAVDPGAIDRAAERAAEKVARVFGDNGNTATKALPARTEVVLWEGAEHNERNVRLARTRSAYLEAHGNVADALAALKAAGDEVSRSTFYNHMDALDKAIPRWRESVQLSNPTGNLDGMRNVGTRGKSRDRVR